MDTMTMIWDDAPIGLIIVDMPGAHISYANSCARSLHVVDEHAQLAADLYEHIEIAWASSMPSSVDLNMDHLRIHVDIRSSKDHIILYCTDESENARMESARRDFVANVSHELKTPVGAMSLLSEALLESTNDPEQVEYFGKRIFKEAQRMGSMITELISLSKLQGAQALPELSSVKIMSIVDSAVARNQAAADSVEITIIQDSDPDVKNLSVSADADLLITALSNLITNAINYSSSQTTVRVIVKKQADQVIIQVIDQGLGIAPKYHKRVFERFFRVDKARSRSTGGTGLGLAIVKHAIALHNGSIELESTLGQGSTFSIHLPIEKDVHGSTSLGS